MTFLHQRTLAVFKKSTGAETRQRVLPQAARWTGLTLE
jgi:hypothetical protein